MKRSFKLGLSAIAGATVVFISNLAAFGVSVVESEHGLCTIDTGTEQISAYCITHYGGGGGVEMIGVVFPGDDGRIMTNDDQFLGQYNYDFEASSPRKYFTWADGTEEEIRGSRFGTNGAFREWTFWLERGWAINFEGMPMSQH